MRIIPVREQQSTTTSTDDQQPFFPMSSEDKTQIESAEILFYLSKMQTSISVMSIHWFMCGFPNLSIFRILVWLVGLVSRFSASRGENRFARILVTSGISTSVFGICKTRLTILRKNDWTPLITKKIYQAINPIVKSHTVMRECV